METDLDKWLYALKHLTEFKERPQYLNGSEFDPLFDLAKYANLNEEERNMYNDSLKHKWDNENVMDYAVKTAKEEGRKEERAKVEEEKKEMARKIIVDMALKLKRKGMPSDEISDATGLHRKDRSAIKLIINKIFSFLSRPYLA